MRLLALLGPFTDRNDRFFYPFICFKQWNPYPFFIKRYHFRAEPPCSIGRHYWEYPPGINLPQELEERKVIIAVADPGEGPAGLGPPYF